jgi:DNA-binding transcriptional LysR family regulator
MLRNNTIELGVLTLPIQYPDLAVVPLRAEVLVVVASPQHPVLAKRRWIKAREIQNYPLIIYSRGNYLRNILEEFFRRAGITPRIAMEPDNIGTIKSLVKINLGISIIPFHSIGEEVKRREIHYLKIRNYKITRQLGLAYQKSDHLPRILRELIRLFKKGEIRDA